MIVFSFIHPGLSASCETLLYSEMSVIRTDPIILNGDGLSRNDTLNWTIASPEPKSNVTNNFTNDPLTYKFFVPNGVGMVTWRVNVLNACVECPFVTFHVQARGLPNPKSFIQTAVIFPNKSGDTSMDFYPQQNAWHYIDMGFLLAAMTEDENVRVPTGAVQNTTAGLPAGNETQQQERVTVNFAVDFNIELNYLYETKENTSNGGGNNSAGGPAVTTSNGSVDSAEDVEDMEGVSISSQRNIQYYPLLRHTYREFFMFDYDLLPDVNGSVPSFINLTAGTPAGFRFEVGDVFDIGGTLSFAVAIRDNVKDYPTHIKTGAIVAEKLVDSSGADVHDHVVGTEEPALDKSSVVSSAKAVGRSNQTIIICMRLNEPGIPTWPDKCTYGRHVLPAVSIVNNTNEDTKTGLIHIPFPEAGLWHVTLGLFCHGSETSARITIIDSVKEFIKRHVVVLDDVRAPCACLNRSDIYRKCITDPPCLAKMNETETLKVSQTN